MTTTENYLALLVVKENFGEIPRLICNHLIQKKSYPIQLIASDLDLDRKIISQALTILVVHNIIEYSLNSKNILEYRFRTQDSLDLLKISRSISKIEIEYGSFAASLIGQFYLNGSLEMSLIILKVLDSHIKINNITDEAQIDSSLSQIKQTFVKLVEYGYVIKAAKLEKSEESIIPIFNSEIEEAEIPEIKFNGLSIKKLLELNDYDSMLQINEDYGDKNVYWNLNKKRFLQSYRDQLIVEAVKNRIDNNAANMISILLKLSNTKFESDKANQSSYISKTVTSIDIQKFMRLEHKMDSITVEKYLTVIQQDSFKVLEKIGDFGGGAYAIDFKKVLHNLCVSHIESVIRERYGSKSLRIFKVIMDKVQLEQKQIEEFSMIPAKECKSLLYGMFNDGMLGITELSKTVDHAPSRTYYLFYIDVYLICKKLLDNAYKSMANLLIKRDFLTSENKRLIEKNKKMDCIIESLKSQGAEQAEIDEVKTMISEDELKMLNSFNDHVNRIELAESQLEESIAILELYFYYHTVPPVINTGRVLDLKSFINKLDRPCVFKSNILKGSAKNWNLENICEVFKNEKFDFRIGKKQKTSKVQFENECDYVEATLSEFVHWINFSNHQKRPRTSTPFDQFDSSEVWAYADYKYMVDLCSKYPSISNCIDWSGFGFDKRNASDSTLWIGSKQANTPCHFDTYGYNLVAQIFGSKRWIMFSPSDSKFMYPSRIPFEESTVYSQINIKYPDLKKYPLFNKVSPYVVDLEPGDILFVPHHWWHYVESLTDSISINTWVEMKQVDDFSRLKEILSKTIIQGLMESNFIDIDSWINKLENYSSQKENIELIKNCIESIRSEKNLEEEEPKNFITLVESNKDFNYFVKQISFNEFMSLYATEFPENISTESNEFLLRSLSNSITDYQVIDLIAKNLINNYK